MAKKKFKSLRPYQTVVQAKKPEPPPKEEDQPSTSNSPAVSTPAGPEDASTQAGRTEPAAPAEAVDPRRLRIQELAVKLQEKIDKDVSLILRVASTPPLKRPEKLDDKYLGKLGLAFGVLRRLGFSEERVFECLKAIPTVELEDALDWLYLNCEEAELLNPKGESGVDHNRDASSTGLSKSSEPSAPSSAPSAPQSIPATPVLKPTPVPSEKSTGKRPRAKASPVPTPPRRAVPAPTQTTPAPESASSESSSETESETDSDEDPNVAFARLKIRLKVLPEQRDPDGLRAANLKKRMDELQKHYFFKQSLADKEFKLREKEMQESALLARLRNMGRPTPPTKASAPTKQETPRPDFTPVAAVTTATASSPSTSDDEPMLGNLMEPESPVKTNDPDGAATRPSVTVTPMRDMSMPKQWGGQTPKKLLQEVVRKADRTASLTYSPLSTDRAARASVKIRFSGGRMKNFDMTDISCPDMHQAEHYIALIALHSITFPPQPGFVGNVNSPTYFRTLSPVFIELWNELESKRKEEDATKNLKTWSQLFGILESKVETRPETIKAEEGVEVNKDAVTTPNRHRGGPSIPAEQLRQTFQSRVATPAYQEMLAKRNTLPIAAYRHHIIEALEMSQVIVLSGETGCGKSTQLPSFILEDQLSKGIPCKILVTEPRRISAITLAQRVSQELGEAPQAVGTSSSLVGYAIRLESHTSQSTRLTFCTNGIALRMFESGGQSGSGGSVDDITHIVVDEVHERSIDSDFLLIVLKSLLDQRSDLKIVLMSATLDAAKISSYFGGCPTLQVPGRTFPVSVQFLEDAVEYTKWAIQEGSPYAMASSKGKDKKPKKTMDWDEDAVNAAEDDVVSGGPSGLKLEKRYSAVTRSTMEVLDQRLIPYGLIIRIIERICFEDPEYSGYSAAVLVFMPGINEIRKLHDALVEHPQFGEDDFRIYPLHSTISSEDQTAAFEIPPRGMRKIVIATNIAETGITIPDVTCVIDSGKHRENRFDEKRQISRLTETFIAKSNAAQRRGRAGRVRDGLCFHLFTKYRHDNSVQALTFSEEITPMGRLLSKMPIDVHLGKFILTSVVMKCLDPALTIAAALSAKSPFLTPFGQEEEADKAKQKFNSDNSDFLTVHNAFSAWRRVLDKTSVVRKFCRENYVSFQTMQQIEEIRQQLLAYLADSGFIQADRNLLNSLSRARYSRWKTHLVPIPVDYNVHGEDNRVISSALGAGLYPKILSVDTNSGVLRTLANNQAAAFHPSSVNFRLRGRPQTVGAEYLAFFTLMHSTKLYVWETGPVDSLALVLLCGDTEFKCVANCVIIDRKIKFNFSPKTVLALKYLRRNVTIAVSQRMKGKTLMPQQEMWLDMMMDILGSSEKKA
ncbi:hypothetical protein M407DRAFT_217155 [Tulasnella calospora MUT 4182]|uniref:RNA helicase n=1 Tax=Tulasnella calospora MUT 4182 TaxID=1051891 RepID=A0A0C3LD84_9AGAM|nr:hypothetical protein M407DRAFT_217155 [Tulasnella calospora MUT 4182]